MSARPIDDCEACRDALTELVCDELDADTRAAVLVHTQHCTGCAAELARFRGVMQASEALPMEAPPRRIHDAVMLAAREAQARRAALTQGSRVESEGLLALVRNWLTRAGTWAMAPQVAMASVLLLMLGIGLVALPSRDAEQPALRAAEEAAAPPPASATATAAPVAPPAPAMEMNEAVQTASGEKAAKNADADGPGADGLSDLSRRRSQPRPSPARSGNTKGYKTEPYGSYDEPYGSPAQQAAPPQPAEKKMDAARSRAKAAFPDSAEQESLGGARDSNFATPPPPQPAAASATAGRSLAEAAEDDVSPEAQLLAQGIRAARSGDHAGAIAVLKPLASKASSAVRRDASIWLARSYRALDNCTDALRYYVPLTASASASPALLSEAADCHERTGDSKLAASLRSRAMPSKASAKPASAVPAASE